MVLADDLVTRSELRSGHKEKDKLLLQLLQKKGNYYYYYYTNYCHTTTTTTSIRVRVTVPPVNLSLS